MTITNIKKFYFEFVLLALLIFMYSADISVWFSKWTDLDSPYAFGFFMFAFIFYILKQNCKKIIEARKSYSLYGIVLVLVGLLLYVTGFRTEIDYLVCVSLPVFIGGIVLGLYGINVFKIIFAPLILFTFTLPILPIHKVTLPMQFLSAKLTVGFLNILGLPAYNDGSIINVFKYKLSVEAACSGLRSLISLFFTSIIFSYFIEANKIKKFIFVLISIPLALTMNICRLTLVSFFAAYNGYNGLQEFHDTLGIVLFIVSLGIIIFISRLIEDTKEKNPYETFTGTGLNLGSPSSSEESTNFSTSDSASHTRFYFKIPGLFWKWYKFLLLIILLLAILLANYRFNNIKVMTPAINEVIPHTIGNWTSRDSKPGKAVYRMISPDEMLLRGYKNSKTGQIIGVSIVLTNKRDHIHDPESCYKLQGIVMKKEKVIKISSSDSVIYADSERQKQPYDIYYWYTDLNKNYTSRTEFMKHIALTRFFNKPVKGYGLVIIMSERKDRNNLIQFVRDINKILMTSK